MDKHPSLPGARTLRARQPLLTDAGSDLPDDRRGRILGHRLADGDRKRVPWPLILAGTVGSTAGNYVWYWVGDRLGYRRLKPWIRDHGRWLVMSCDDLDKAVRFFQSHGQWVVFGLRFSPFLRTMVSLPAGLSHMSLWRFLLFTFLGAAVWNTLLVEGGRRLAPLIERYEAVASWAVGGLFALILVFYLYKVATWKPREEPED